MLVDTIQVLTAEGEKSSGFPREKILTQPGELAAITGKVRWYPSGAAQLVSATVNVGTPTTGASLTVQLKKNGVAVGSPIVLAAGESSSTPVLITDTVTSSDYITVDVVQVGTTYAGSDMTVIIKHYAALN